MAEDEGSADVGGVLMIRSKRSGWSIRCDIVDPRLFESQAAKEIMTRNKC